MCSDQVQVSSSIVVGRTAHNQHSTISLALRVSNQARMVLAYIPNPPCRPGGVILHVVSVPLLVLDFRVSDPIMLLSCRSQKVRDSLFPLSDLRAYEKLEFPDNQEQRITLVRITVHKSDGQGLGRRVPTPVILFQNENPAHM